jgi:excisionase family DNA binding protein
MKTTSWLTPTQVAEQLGCDTSNVWSWIAAGQLPAVDVSKGAHGRPRWRIDPNELQAFLLKRRHRQPASRARRHRAVPGVVEFF